MKRFPALAPLLAASLTCCANPQPRAGEENRAEVGIESRTLPDGLGQGLGYDWIARADARPDAPLVVVGHGFMRSAARMRGWGEHLAEAGYVVAVANFRHSRAWAGNHAKNAGDLAALAERESVGRKFAYLGYSAGGCSAMLAAGAKRPDALVLLDPVFGGAATADQAKELELPALAQFARPGQCNANASGRPVAEALPRGKVVDLPAASHAHFEFPLDPLALRVCGRAADGKTDVEIQREILEQVTRFLREHLPPPER